MLNKSWPCTLFCFTCEPKCFYWLVVHLYYNTLCVFCARSRAANKQKIHSRLFERSLNPNQCLTTVSNTFEQRINTSWGFDFVLIHSPSRTNHITRKLSGFHNQLALSTTVWQPALQMKWWLRLATHRRSYSKNHWKLIFSFVFCVDRHWCTSPSGQRFTSITHDNFNYNSQILKNNIIIIGAKGSNILYIGFLDISLQELGRGNKVTQWPHKESSHNGVLPKFTSELYLSLATAWFINIKMTY